MTTANSLERDFSQETAPKVIILEPQERYEVVNGLIVEEPPLGAREGCIATTIAFLINRFIWGKRLGRVISEVLFVLAAEPRLRRCPDVAFVSAERWPMSRAVPTAAAWNVVPDLAIEVISPTDLSGDVQTKIADYFRAGVRLVWLVYPDQAEIYLYKSTRMVRVFGREESIDAGDLLPGLELLLNEIFETETDEPPADPA